MLFLSKYKDLVPYVMIALLLLKLYGNSWFNSDVKEEIKIDSTKVTKVIQEQKGRFVSEKIQPIVIYPPSTTNPKNNTSETNKILGLIKAIQGNQTEINTEQKEMKALLEIIAKKEYRNNYSDSIVNITVKDVVENGKLKSQIVDWKVKESYIDYFEKKHTYKLKPKFTLSAGLGLDSRLDKQANPQLKAVIGVKNKKGVELQFGYSTDSRASLLLKYDWLTKY